MMTFAIVVAALIGSVILIFYGLIVWGYGSIWIGCLVERKRLASRGRVLTLEEAKRRINGGDGTIVIDHPSLGWGVARAWWAPLGVALARPNTWPEEDLCPAEDHFNFDRLIHTDTGEASLIRPFIFSDRVEQFLFKHFGKIDHVFIFSGGMAFDRTLTKKEAEAGTCDAEESV
jgi:hypothetical protein